MNQPYLDGLNDGQREAVLTTEGPLLVLAGAGTGKTRVLTTRIAHLIKQHKAAPWQILSVTFTNKAAGEMRERVEGLLSQPEPSMSDGAWSADHASHEPAGAAAEAFAAGKPEANSDQREEITNSKNFALESLPPEYYQAMQRDAVTPATAGAPGSDPGVAFANRGDNSPASSGLWLGTFHSIGVKILRRHAELLGFTQQFTILDADDQHRLIKQIMAEHNIDNTKQPGKVIISIIQGWKDKGLIPEKVTGAMAGDGAGAVAAALYRPYQERLQSLNAMDFGDLLLHCLTLFQAHPHILKEYQQRFHYILVDEYQDTNVAQYLWLRLLAQGYENLCCVGDDDQSIYGWRGAEVGNILKFEKDFPDAQTIRLECNYRSTPPILAAASHLIAHNKERLGKTLYTDDKSKGDPLKIKSVWDDAEEARFVGEEIETFQRDGHSLNDMAVLVRAGYQTRAFEERFMTLGLNYRVVGGLRFYERMEIRDAIAYLRLVNQGQDDLAFERIVNTPKRGVGKATLEQIHTHAREHNLSLFDSLCVLLNVTPATAGAPGSDPGVALANRGDSDMMNRGQQTAGADSVAPATVPSVLQEAKQGNIQIKGKAAKALGEFVKNILRWRTLAEAAPIAELMDTILEDSGYRAMWQNDKSPEAAGRVENLRELVRALGEFESMEQFLEHISLVMDRDSEAGAQAQISVMSLHAAKGLEFPVVFLTGWEEGLFPSQRTMDEKGTSGLEEERRLAYVGITRARKHCIISHAANRRIYNQWQSSIPSRFLQELPEEHIEILEGGAYSQRASGPQLFQKGIDSFVKKGPKLNAAPPSPTGFSKGQMVNHVKFGSGIIINIEGDHLTVAFKAAGKKKIMADYVKAA